MEELLKKCNLCPRNCLVNRYEKVGYCGCGSNIKIALVSTHMWEEPFISGNRGSGTIFFSCCNLKCMFCQNKKIREGYGKEVSLERFRDILIEQQNRGVHNINLVTPTPYIPLIKNGIMMAKEKGLTIPIVYNTNSYINISALRKMNGLVDIYLADLKYYDNSFSKKYSDVSNYFDMAS